MGNYPIEFAKITWTSMAQGVRVKEVVRGGHRIRLVEFSEGFAEAGWCEKHHIGFVVEGELAVEFSEGVVQLKAGDGLFIPPGSAARHKARAPRGSAVLFLVETAAST